MRLQLNTLEVVIKNKTKTQRTLFGGAASVLGESR